ncbi:MAG: threonylcarbamoyl-AMP synthase [Alicyclobacillus sp.]|nr:threonylcarbamoyl-AMP synthase [Alicyclobacillus sp.]
MKVWSVDLSDGNWTEVLQEPAQRLRAGGVVAFPTETVYGLGGNAWDDAACRKIFAAKGRPADNPLIVHIADRNELAGVTSAADCLPSPLVRLLDAFWPGPLTIILPAHPQIAPSVRPGGETVGVRMPSHPVARALIRQAGCPLAAPSANSSGRPSPTTAAAVVDDLEGRIDGVIDGGPCDVGLESTVVAVTESSGTVYRPGWITPEQLSAVSGVPFSLDPHLLGAEEAPKAPGMKYRHYAPDARVHVWWGDRPLAVLTAIRRFVMDNPGIRPAYVLPADFPDLPNAVWRWSPDPATPYDEALSHALYHLLREGDTAGATDICIVGTRPSGRGLALMNRLQKASEGRLYRV